MVLEGVVYNHWTGMVEWNSGMERFLLVQFSVKVTAYFL